MSGTRPTRVALLSPQSNRNLGDTATFAAAIAAYRRRIPDIELVAVVPEPAESARLLGTAGFPLFGDGSFVSATSEGSDQHATTETVTTTRLASMRRIYAFVGELDAIVFTGGGLLDDFWGGPWKLPFWVLTWVAAARVRGVKVLFHAVGYDRLTSRTSRTLALAALRLAHYRSVRDEQSREMLQAIGLARPSDVLPDLAFALEIAGSDRTAEPALSDPYVIVNPVSERMWSHSHDAKFADYLGAFVDLSRWLLDQGLRVVLLSTQDKMDSDALEYVANSLRSEGRDKWERVHVTRLDQFMALAKRARIVVSSRLHALILAFVAGTPAVSVSPMRKMTRVMLDAGLSDFNIEMASLKREALIATVSRGIADETRLRHRIVRLAAEYRQRLNENFDQIMAAGLLGARARAQFRRDANPSPRGA